MPTCPICRNEIAPYADPCPHCGASLDWGTPTVVSPPVTEASPPASFPSQPGKSRWPWIIGVSGGLALIAALCICGFTLIARPPTSALPTRQAAADTPSPRETKEAMPLPTPTIPAGLAVTADKVTFTLEDLLQAKSIEGPGERHRPKSGVYLIVLGSVFNGSDKDTYIMDKDFSIRTKEISGPSLADVASAAHGLFPLRGWPGDFLGQKVSYDGTEALYVIFDVKPTITDVNIIFRGQSLHIADSIEVTSLSEAQ